MKKMKKMLALLLAVVMTAGMLSACGDEEPAIKEETSDTPAADESETPAGEDTQVMNVRATSFGNNYDVQDMGWRWMMGDCYEGLFRNVADSEGEKFILAGAESMDVSEDGKTYTFHLRKNAKWSDGQPVTAHDYEYGWKRLANPKYGYGYASFIYNVVGAEEYNKGEGPEDAIQAIAVDDYTFQVTLKVADPTFEAKLVATPLYPTRKDIAEAAGDQWGKDWSLCVYNGPFCMTEMVEDNKMVWTKNENYWDAENTHLDQINWLLIKEDATGATMFDNGELDQLQTSGDYSIKYQGKADKGEVQRLVSDYPGTIGLRYNFMGNDPSGLMSNVKIRKAISYAIDREEMIAAVYGRYKPAYSYVAPAISFNGKSFRSQTEEVISEELAEYNNQPEKLQALFQEGLDELGVTTPISDITLTYLCQTANNEQQAETEYLQQTLQDKLGCKVELNVVGDYALYKAERSKGNFDIMNGGWFADYNDPMDFMFTYYTDAYGDSYGKYSNPKYDALIDSLTGEKDTAKRLETYKELEHLLMIEDCAFAPIYYSTKEVFLQNWVKDYRTSSFGASAEFYITYVEGRGK